MPSSGLLRVESHELIGLAYGMLAITAASMASMVYGAYTIFQSEQIRTTTTLGSTNSLISFITDAFSNRNYYWKIMIVAAISYGIFFGLIPCCAAPGYMPMLTFYITDHFLILIIPLNVILATIVSLLVGFNVALSIFAFRFKKSLLQTKTSLAAGIGATSGLYVWCPTCAGSLISALLGIGVVGAGGASASVLAPFQTVFIAASIPALVVAPFLTARSIRYASSCNIT
jgi:hypothetical protein